MNILNLVYDIWENGEPIPNGKIYYENKFAIKDGTSIIDHSLFHTKENLFEMKKLHIDVVPNFPKEKFYYVINHHVPSEFAYRHVKKNINGYYFEKDGFEIITDKLKDYLRKMLHTLFGQDQN